MNVLLCHTPFFVFVKMISIICKIIINFLKNIQTTWTIISWSELICYGLYLSSINSWRIKYKRIFIQNTVRYCVFNWPFIRRLPKYSIYLQNTGVFPLSQPGLIPLSEPLLTRLPVLIIFNMFWNDFIISIFNKIFKHEFILLSICF